jgi:hypothetical protein
MPKLGSYSHFSFIAVDLRSEDYRISVQSWTGTGILHLILRIQTTGRYLLAEAVISCDKKLGPEKSLVKETAIM